MLRAVTTAADLSVFTQLGLVLFVLTFSSIIVYAATRKRTTLEIQADLPNRDPRRVGGEERGCDRG